MRVSGARQRNSRNASPENLVSAKNAGRPPNEQDDHGPRREAGEQHRETGDGDRVLEQARGAHDQRQRPARRLAARARQLVVELGVFEVRELERQRLLEDHHVHAMRELGLEQRLAQGDAAVRGGDDHQDQRLGRPPTTTRGHDVHSVTLAVCARRGRSTTLSTMRAPTQATPEGSTPARTVTRPSNNDSGRLVVPDQLERALAVVEDAEELRAAS